MMLDRNQLVLTRKQDGFDPWKLLAVQSRLGVVAYLPLWGVITLPTGFYREFPSFTAVNAGIMFATMIWRIFSLIKFEDNIQRHPLRTKVFFVLGVYFSALHWGTIGALVLWYPEYNSIQLIYLLCLAGITAICVTFSSSSVMFALGYYAMALPPLMVTSLALASGQGVSLFLILVWYWSALMWFGRTLNATYIQAHINANLAEQRAVRFAEISHVDSLTQLKNRHHFEEYYPKQWEDAFSRRESISVLVIDIDYFKEINDEYGHLVGDECLSAIAEIMTSNIRSEKDSVCRYGGDEFVFVLPETDEAGARSLADRLIDSVRELDLDLGVVTLKLTLSIGICVVVPLDEDGYTECLKNADSALYCAKKAGRDCFRVYEAA